MALESTIAQLFLAGPCTWSTLTSISVFQCSYSASMIGGSGEIRTHGALRHDSFQDCCNKPDSATFPLFGAPEETRTPKIWLLRPTRIPIPSPGRFSFFYIMVEIARFEPTHPKEQIYSLPRLSNCAVSPKLHLIVLGV